MIDKRGLVSIMIVALLAGVILFAPFPYYQYGGCLEINIKTRTCYEAGWRLGPSLWWQIFEGNKTVSHSVQPTSTPCPDTNGEQDSQKPSSPLTLDMNFCDTPMRGQTARLIVNAKTLVKAPNTSIEVILPTGVELVEGNLTWNGDLAVNEMHKLQITVRFNQDGEFVISAELGKPALVKSSLYVKIEGSYSTVTNYPIATPDPARPQVERSVNSSEQRPDYYNPSGK